LWVGSGGENSQAILPFVEASISTARSGCAHTEKHYFKDRAMAKFSIEEIIKNKKEDLLRAGWYLPSVGTGLP